jgi:hypothetical protein
LSFLVHTFISEGQQQQLQEHLFKASEEAIAIALAPAFPVDVPLAPPFTSNN